MMTEKIQGVSSMPKEPRRRVSRSEAERAAVREMVKAARAHLRGLRERVGDVRLSAVPDTRGRVILGEVTHPSASARLGR